MLERANAELERKVAPRTHDPVEADHCPRNKVLKREPAEAPLRAAEQAGPRQSATGNTHEFTRPPGIARTAISRNIIRHFGARFPALGGGEGGAEFSINPPTPPAGDRHAARR